MIRIYILRHGEAEPYRQTDETRELTPMGVRDAKGAGIWLKNQGVKLDHVFCSPYTRTRQTREHFLSGYGEVVPVDEKDWLTPENDARKVVSLLCAENRNAGNILLVSHMPLVSALVATLVDGSHISRSNYSMMPASMAELSMESCGIGLATFHRLLSPPYR